MYVNIRNMKRVKSANQRPQKPLTENQIDLLRRIKKSAISDELRNYADRMLEAGTIAVEPE